jgi:hypothetical protein
LLGWELQAEYLNPVGLSDLHEMGLYLEKLDLLGLRGQPVIE